MREIQLHGVKARSRTAKVDDEDYELVQNYRWTVFEDTSRTGHPNGPYAVSQNWDSELGRSTALRMHKLITGWPRTDHIDGDGLNNQRSNLRPASNRENTQNQRKTTKPTSSKYKGVSRVQHWVAQIGLAGRVTYLGRFQDEDDAARAYNAAARELFGEYARLNDVDPPFPTT